MPEKGQGLSVFRDSVKRHRL